MPILEDIDLIQAEVTVIQEMARVLAKGEAKARSWKSLKFNGPEQQESESRYNNILLVLNGALKTDKSAEFSDQLLNELRILAGRLSQHQIRMLQVRAWDIYKADQALKKGLNRQKLLSEAHQRSLALTSRGLSQATADKLLKLMDLNTALLAASWCNFVRGSYSANTVGWLKDQLADPQRVRKMTPAEIQSLCNMCVKSPEMLAKDQLSLCNFAIAVGIILNSRRPTKSRRRTS